MSIVSAHVLEFKRINRFIRLDLVHERSQIRKHSHKVNSYVLIIAAEYILLFIFELWFCDIFRLYQWWWFFIRQGAHVCKFCLFLEIVGVSLRHVYLHDVLQRAVHRGIKIIQLKKQGQTVLRSESIDKQGQGTMYTNRKIVRIRIYVKSVRNK